MGTWNDNVRIHTTAGGVSGNSEFLNEAIGGRVRTGTEGHLGTSSGGYSVVGMKVESVNQMRDALRNYVKRIQDHLEQIDSTTTASNAFRSAEGELEAAVQNYINNVKEYCQVLTSSLLAFSDRLAVVRSVWISRTGNAGLAGVINEDISTQTVGTSYQDNLQS